MRRSFLVAGMAVLVWTAGRLSAPAPEPAPVVAAPVVHVHAAPPAPDPLPVPPLPEWSDRGRARFALRDAPGVLTEWSGVVAAGASPVLAVWNGEVLMWSGDDGQTWTRHTLPQGQTVSQAAAEDGWLHFLLSGERGALWSFSPAGTRTARPAPLAPQTTESLTARFGRVAVLGLRPTKVPAGREVEKEMALLVSADHGETWRDLPAPPSMGNAGHDMLLEADGSVVRMWGQEAACGGGYQDRARLSPGASEWTSLPWPLDAPVRFWLGPGGWAYSADDGCNTDKTPLPDGRIRLCAIGDGDGTIVPGPEMDDRARIDFVSGGRVVYAVAGRALFVVKGSSFRRVATDVPASFQSGHVDAAGRLVAIAGGRVVRWSAAGWEVLLPG
jgi:hypothetical protein